MIELGPFHEAPELVEIVLRFTGMADDEGRSKHEVRNRSAQALHDFVHALPTVPATHRLQHCVRSMLKRHVDIRQHLIVLREDLDERVGQLLGIEVMCADPANAIDIAECSK